MLQVLFSLPLLKKQIVLTADGVGEWATTTVAVGSGNELDIKKEIHFPHSSRTCFILLLLIIQDLKLIVVNTNLMGLAPYGNPTYVDKIKKLSRY